MTDPPEWALPIRDEMARAIFESMAQRSVTDREWQAAKEDGAPTSWATAALTVALPLIAEHMAGVAESVYRKPAGIWHEMAMDRIAAAIRQEAKTKNAE